MGKNDNYYRRTSYILALAYLTARIIRTASSQAEYVHAHIQALLLLACLDLSQCGEYLITAAVQRRILTELAVASKLVTARTVLILVLHISRNFIYLNS